jgi:hypothetical protein
VIPFISIINNKNNNNYYSLLGINNNKENKQKQVLFLYLKDKKTKDINNFISKKREDENR